MARYIKFTLDQGGNLVYRNTGKYYMKKFTVKGHTVYGANGRKIGTVGKPTGKQAKRIERAKINREKRVRQATKKMGAKRTGSLSYRDLADIHDAIDYKDYSIPVSRYQQELYNLSSALRDCVDAGYMSEEEAQSFINKWMDATNDDERDGVWNEVKSRFKDLGYEYE